MVTLLALYSINRVLTPNPSEDLLNPSIDSGGGGGP